jgi:ornithine cyclodeaminase/alanine dehydrogenase-like protein (mu-crystallin family)
VPGDPHPENETQITVAKLIGLGVQDLAAAEVALQRLTVGTRHIVARRPPASILDLH